MSTKKFSYNEAMLEVEKILASLEKDNPDIDEMSVNVKRAVELLQSCKEKLYQTDEEIKKVFEELKVQ
jgi:exodeoxyribonuclease VII small subunit